MNDQYIVHLRLANLKREILILWRDSRLNCASLAKIGTYSSWDQSNVRVKLYNLRTGEVLKKTLDTRRRPGFYQRWFSFWAMIAPPLWMIYHHLWRPLIGFFIAALIFVKLLVWLFALEAQAGWFIAAWVIRCLWLSGQ